MNKKRLFTKEILEEAVKNSLSIADVCRFVGCKARGGSYENIRNRLKEYNIDTSHFLGKNQYTGRGNRKPDKRTKKPEEVLVDGNLYRTSHSTLKRCLIECGIEYKCSQCGIYQWLDKKITLDIDHINGDWRNNTITNLRFLCPNCHRQTDSFCKKKKDKTVKFTFCKICNAKIFKNVLYCSKKCKTYNRRKNIPSKEDILEAFKQNKTILQTGKYFGVSDNGLRKWCKIYDILEIIKEYKK